MPGASSNAGDVIVTATEQLSVTDSIIDTSSLGSGAAGTVRIVTGPEDTLGGAMSLKAAGSVSTSTFGGGAAGTVTIRTGALSVQDDGSQIASTTSASGNAGSVDVAALTVAVTDNGKSAAMPRRERPVKPEQSRSTHRT